MKRNLAVVFVLVLVLTGCSSMPPIKDGEITVGANTKLGMDDVGVARVRNEF